MVGGRVERVEAMILVLDLRPVGDGETDFAERADDVVGDLRERMQFAERAAASGQREIRRLFRQRGLQFQFLAARRERGFEFHLGGVDEFAGGGLFFLGERAELFHQRGELAVRPDPRALGLFQRGEVGRGFEFGQRGLFQRINFVEKSAIKFGEVAEKDAKDTKEKRADLCWPPRQLNFKFEIERFEMIQALASVAPGLAFSAFLASVTSSPKAAASVAARSAMTLRSSAHLAAFKPSMKRL